MKKQDKINLIQRAIDTPQICRCYFTYDDDYFYYYPNAVTDKFLLGQEEDNFLLDGYSIRKVSQLKKVEIKDDLCNTINKHNGLHQQIQCPPVDLSDWKSIFDSLQALDCFVIIEDELGEQFAIGTIMKTFKSKLYFHAFDADGVWEEWEIPYSQITSVHWQTRYTQGWQRYLEQK